MHVTSLKIQKMLIPRIGKGKGKENKVFINHSNIAKFLKELIGKVR